LAKITDWQGDVTGRAANLKSLEQIASS
jgi:hypothetical protein